MAKMLSLAQDMDMGSLNKITYPQRLFVWLLGYSLLLVGCFIGFQYLREKEFKVEEMNTRLQLINSYIITELDKGYDIKDIDLSDFHLIDNLRVSIISVNGNVVYDNSTLSLPNDNHLDREEIRMALKLDSGYTIRRHSESTGNYYFYSATKSDQGYVVRTALPYSVSLSSLLKADYTFLWTMGVISLAMCILGYIATRRIGIHIIRLNKFAENVETGIKISNTEPFPNDELGSISNHIIRLYAKLQQAYIDRDKEHKAVLHEQLEKERIKKQLTNNINHELKTPVASIKICIETLIAHKNLSEEKRDLFLQRCLSNTERLQHLLTDVSLITRMDDGNNSILKEKINLSEIIGNVVEDRLMIANSKGIIIENDVAGELFMNGNTSLLEAVFNNLVDNAIAYSDGSLIRINLIYENDKKLVLSFSDNGTGVLPEHLSRLFERFYRIDKGRSRSVGGTGLGLSIVKNAILLHGGTISVENLLTGGLSFKITLLKNS